MSNSSEPAPGPAHHDACDHRFVHDALVVTEGLQVSKSPWGESDQIGRLNWITPESRNAIFERIDGRGMFDLSVDYFIGMPAWLAGGDPAYNIWMTHTPGGNVNENTLGLGSEINTKFSHSGDSVALYTHCGTHIDALNHRGYYDLFWNGWSAERDLGSRNWLKGGTDHYPPIVAKATMLDIAGLHSVDCLPDSYSITPADLRAAAREQGSTVEPKSIVMIRTGRMSRWPDPDGYLLNSPGVGLAAAKYLCEEVGAMCVASDSIALEVMPSENPDEYMPVHSYMFATAGAQIIEVVDMEEIAAERQYEFALLGFPLKLTGATGAPIRPVAIPLR